MRATETLERQRTTDERAERLLVGALRGKKGALTRADAVALTGLSTDQTEGALRSLLQTYRSHLAVTESGELLYQFDPAMVRRDAVPLGERLAAVGRLVWRGFTFLFKVWIVVTLVVYVLAFLAMLIGLVFARSSSDRDDRRRGGGFDFPWILWWLMPDWAPPEYQRQRRREPGKRFYLAVFDFVFGPKRPPLDPLLADRESVAFLRAMDGRITATDLVALTGWSYERAEQEATRLLAAYDGEPEVTESGAIVYAFPSLRRTAGATDDRTSWRYAWQERPAVPPLTGNTPGLNAAIAAMNGFNLFAALVIGPAFLLRYGIESPSADLLVTYFPLAFSSLFFGIPGVRSLRRRRLAKQLAREQVRAALLQSIVERRGAAATPDELVRGAAERAALPPKQVERELDRLLADLDGDVQTDDNGTLRYVFPRIADELGAAERARALAPSEEREAGAVVFSSDDESDSDSRPRLN